MKRVFIFGAIVPAILFACRGNGEREPSPASSTDGTFQIDVLLEGLDLPASLAFTPDGRLLILERGLTTPRDTAVPSISVVDVAARTRRVLGGVVPAVSHFDDLTGNQGGALGLAIDPGFSDNHRVYVCYHARASNGHLVNRLSSFEVGDDQIGNERRIIDDVPGDATHNGCRVAIDSAGLIYLTTGSLEPFDDAQDLTRLSGKVLRTTSAGEIPSDNPFPNSLIWTYGHRNPQGLAFDPVTGALWSTEHGEESADELNLLERGANYGWAACRGSAGIGETYRAEPYWSDRLKISDGLATCQLAEPHATRYRPAAMSFYEDRTVGISDLVVYRGNAFPTWHGNLLIAMLRAGRLVRIDLTNFAPIREETIVDGQFGRLRDVTVGPDGFVYVLTNEPGADGRWRGHSRLLRLRPAAVTSQ